MKKMYICFIGIAFMFIASFLTLVSVTKEESDLKLSENIGFFSSKLSADTNDESQKQLINTLISNFENTETKLQSNRRIFGMVYLIALFIVAALCYLNKKWSNILGIIILLVPLGILLLLATGGHGESAVGIGSIIGILGAIVTIIGIIINLRNRKLVNAI